MTNYNLQDTFYCPVTKTKNCKVTLFPSGNKYNVWPCQGISNKKCKNCKERK